MKTALVSDVHANLDALETVLRDIEQAGADRVFCLGDLVGYGPEPNECVARLREVCAEAVIGNHDWAALGRMDTLAFNAYARAASDWTSRTLNEDARAYLAALPLFRSMDEVRLVHASPLEPERWTYVLSFLEAMRQFEAFPERVCFLGHSHLPTVIEKPDESGEVDTLPFPENEPVVLKPDARYIVNVGSVGQPRDRDPRAAYVLYDDVEHTVMLRRVEYPVERVQEKIRAAGLPVFLAQRLGEGV